MKITNEDIGEDVKNELAVIEFTHPFLSATTKIILNYIELLEEENKTLKQGVNPSYEETIKELEKQLFDSIPKSELKSDLKYMKNAKATGVKQLLMKKGIIGYLEKLLGG